MGEYVFLACFSAYVAWVLTLRVKELLHTRVVRKLSHNERRKWDKSSMARLKTRWLVLPLARSIQLLLLFWNTTLLTLLSKTVLTSTNFISREYTSFLIAWKKTLLKWKEKTSYLLRPFNLEAHGFCSFLFSVAVLHWIVYADCHILKVESGQPPMCTIVQRKKEAPLPCLHCPCWVWWWPLHCHRSPAPCRDLRL